MASAPHGVLQSPQAGGASAESAAPSPSFLHSLKKAFCRPLCCFPEAAAARPEGAYAAACWLPPILGFAPIWWLTLFAFIGCGVAAHIYWQPVLLTALVVLGYILSVALHEFAHAATAFRGGDDSVVYSGYLTLDYLRYASPLFSIGLPVVFLLLGGVALPGAAVSIEHTNLRGPKWQSLTALVGPFANLLCGFLFSGLLQLTCLASHDYYTVLHMGLACLIYFEAMIFLINLVPFPPLDGWGALEPWLPSSCLLKKAMADPVLGRVVSLVVLAALFPIFARVPFIAKTVMAVAVTVFQAPEELLLFSMQSFSLSFGEWRYVHPLPIRKLFTVPPPPGFGSFLHP